MKRAMVRGAMVSTAIPSPDNQAMLERVLSVRKALFIGAHPDDIEFYCGVLARMMADKGTDVVFAIATRGGRGRMGRARERMESLRSAHQEEAARMLGARVVLFDYPDKDLSRHVEPLSEDLKDLVAREGPELVFSWDPDFIYNPHPDHQAVADASRLAAEGRPMCFYGTRRPNLWVGCDGPAFRAKIRAIRAHRTETPWYFWPIPRRHLLTRSRGEGAKVGAAYAEVYRLSRSPDG